MNGRVKVPDEKNDLRTFLLGGEGAPTYAPEGLLARRKITIEQLAEASKISRTVIYMYVAGTSRPTAPTFRRICDALNVRYYDSLKFCTPAKMGRPLLTDRQPVPERRLRLAKTDSRKPNKDETRLEVFERIADSQKERREFQRASGAVARTPKKKSSDEDPAKFSAGRERVATDDRISVGVFARELNRLMKQHDPPLDIGGLSTTSGVLGYEHARRSVRGIVVPSDSIVRELARFFGVEVQTLVRIAKNDRLAREYGESCEMLMIEPELAEFGSAWSTLTDNQKESLKTQLDLFLKQNQARDKRERTK
jgi:transcriptional regulator with XRE-family HTH domain